jgi:hypothetical protein
LLFYFKIEYFSYQERGSAKEVGRGKDFELEEGLIKFKLGGRR